MNYTQNERIAQVGDNTLVVGIDIGSDKHYARAFTERGMEISRKAFVFENTESGFGLLDAWMEKLAGENGKARIIVGFEPTGHYWFLLGHHLEERGTAFVVVAPQHVKHSKELDDNTQRKDDRKDPRVIAKLVIEGRYSIAYMPEGKFAELRIVYNRRCELVEQQTRVMNRIMRWFDIYFPEYRTVYGKVDAISGMMILKRVPLPKDILELGVEGVNAIWRDAKLKGAGMKRAQTLVAAAEHSIGLDGGYAAKLDLWQLLEEYELVASQLAKVMEAIEELLAEIPEAGRIMEIKGVGVVIAAGLLAEIGDIKRFNSPKQIQKLAGLAIVENSSGKHKGRSGISRRGRKRLRKILFLAAVALVGHNDEFRQLHQYTDRVHALLVQPRPETPNVIRLSESASRLFDDIREKNEARILGDLSGALKDSGWTGKHDGRLLRIAATLALIDGDSEIEKEHLLRAQKIGEWAIEHARSMMERTGDAPRAKARIVWEAICRLGELHFTMRELQRKLGDREGLKRKDDILDVLDVLEEEDYVVPVEVEPEEMKLGVMRWNVSYTHSDEVLQKSE